MNDDCRGRGSCHGSEVWCRKCGDVKYHCDDPECCVHLRSIDFEYKIKDLTRKINFSEIHLDILRKELKEIRDEVSKIEKHRVMVPRGERIDIVERIMNE